MASLALFAAALIAGFSYVLADHVVAPGALHVAWKGAGVLLLALWAVSRARTRDGWWLATAFAVYAVADVALEFDTVAGAAFFIVGHLIMVTFYARHRRALDEGEIAAMALLVAATPIAAFLLSGRPDATAYASVLGLMAAAALASRFRRDWVLLGAVLFVASDLLIFARMGVLHDSTLPGLGVWPLYFAGQVLVVVGVARGLREKRA